MTGLMHRDLAKNNCSQSRCQDYSVYSPRSRNLLDSCVFSKWNNKRRSFQEQGARMGPEQLLISAKRSHTWERGPTIVQIGERPFTRPARISWSIWVLEVAFMSYCVPEGILTRGKEHVECTFARRKVQGKGTILF